MKAAYRTIQRAAEESVEDPDVTNIRGRRPLVVSFPGMNSNDAREREVDAKCFCGDYIDVNYAIKECFNSFSNNGLEC